MSSSSPAISQEEFDRRRIHALRYLNAMTNVATELSNVFPAFGFQAHIPKLNGLKSKLKGGIRPNLTDQDLYFIYSFRDHLINHPTFKVKLAQYYQLAIEYAKDAYQTRKMTLNPQIEEAIKRFANVDLLTREILREASKQPHSILSIASLMLLLTARKETFAYFVMGIVKQTVKTANLSGYDIEEICSLSNKVEQSSNAKQGIKYTTDINAIRDCISHGYYQIRKSRDGKYSLQFDWREPGQYNFAKTFTASEFFIFFQEYVLFEKLQGILLTIGMSEVLMAAGLLKDMK